MENHSKIKDKLESLYMNGKMTLEDYSDIVILSLENYYEGLFKGIDEMSKARKEMKNGNK